MSKEHSLALVLLLLTPSHRNVSLQILLSSFTMLGNQGASESEDKGERADGQGTQDLRHRGR